MGAKHEKAEKNRAKGRMKGKKCSITIAGSAKVLHDFIFLPCRPLATGPVMLVCACNGHLTCVSGQQQDLSGQHGHILF
jgi:hypothetical protein